ncbi:hypothetical protein [Streptomyces sp. NPDC004976]
MTGRQTRAATHIGRAAPLPAPMYRAVRAYVTTHPAATHRHSLRCPGSTAYSSGRLSSSSAASGSPQRFVIHRPPPP